MAKFYGPVGYGETVESAPGVFKQQIVEVTYRGDIVRNTRRMQDGEGVNDDLSVSNSISIVADAYAGEHFHAIKYVKWAGAYWRVTTVTVQGPRLLLQLGGVYSGPKA